MFSRFLIIFALFVVTIDAATMTTTKKPSKAPVAPKPSKTPVSKKPTKAPIIQPRIINTENIPLPYNAYITVAGPKGQTEEQYFNCKGSDDLYEMYATKVGKTNQAYYGNFGIECTGGETVMNWQVLGPELTPDQFHAVWRKKEERVTSLHVFKTLEPTSGYWVVSGVRACFNGVINNCAGPGNPPSACDQSLKAGKLPVSLPACKVENTFAPPNEKLFYWHFKTIITNTTSTRAPGVILEFDASSKPFPNAPKVNIGYTSPIIPNLRQVD